MEIFSSAFGFGKQIPKVYSGEGENKSPPLMWRAVPEGCKSFALVCEDPDAPLQVGMEYPFVHWLIYDLSASLIFLPEGIKSGPRITAPVPAAQGKNTYGNYGYDGPMPPSGHGDHHYEFTLYALDTFLSLPGGLRKEELLERIHGHVLATALLVGTYERQGEARRVS